MKGLTMEKLYVHQHDVADFTQCRFRFYLSFVLGLAPIINKSWLDVGSAFSKALEVVYLTGELANGMATIYSMQEDLKLLARSQDRMDDIDNDCCMTVAMLSAYHKKYIENSTDEIKPEFRIETPIKNHPNFVYVCRLDGLKNNNIIIEDKTTAKIEKDLIEHLPTNFQVNSYWNALLVNGYKIGKINYRYTQKTQIRRKKTETVEAFQLRIMDKYHQEADTLLHEEELLLDTSVLKSFNEDLDWYISEIERAYNYNRWPKNGTMCRTGFNTSCKFLKYCYNPTEETINTYFKPEKTPHKYEQEKREYMRDLFMEMIRAQVNFKKGKRIYETT